MCVVPESCHWPSCRRYEVSRTKTYTKDPLITDRFGEIANPEGRENAENFFFIFKVQDSGGIVHLSAVTMLPWSQTGIKSAFDVIGKTEALGTGDLSMDDCFSLATPLVPEKYGRTGRAKQSPGADSPEEPEKSQRQWLKRDEKIMVQVAPDGSIFESR